MKIEKMLKDYRIENDITQAELAQKIMISQATVASLEKGEKASLLTKGKISKFFNVSIEELE